MTGGGTGGHITPNLAVASELKRLRPDLRVVFIGQKGDQLADIPKQHPAIDAAYAVSAGKFRRYSGQGWRQLLDVPTQAKNVRDLFRFLAGTWQSYWLIRKLHPSVIFTRGGYVSVPVALGGRLAGVPYVTHDSDSTPSLANRLIAKKAVKNLVALPKELYPYPAAKTETVGVPVDTRYQPITQKLQQSYKEELGLGAYDQMVFVTGGGNGADQLNQDILQVASALLARYPKLVIALTAGRLHADSLSKQYDELLPVDQRSRVVVKDFVTDLYHYSGAADVVIARAGATGLAEFAVQGKACIIVPNEGLPWQMHHTKTLVDQHAVRMLTDADAAQADLLVSAIADLLDHPDKRADLGAALAKLALPDAAERLAMVLLDIAKP